MVGPKVRSYPSDPASSLLPSRVSTFLSPGMKQDQTEAWQSNTGLWQSSEVGRGREEHNYGVRSHTTVLLSAADPWAGTLQQQAAGPPGPASPVTFRTLLCVLNTWAHAHISLRSHVTFSHVQFLLMCPFYVPVLCPVSLHRLSAQWWVGVETAASIAVGLNGAELQLRSLQAGDLEGL